MADVQLAAKRDLDERISFILRKELRQLETELHPGEEVKVLSTASTASELSMGLVAITSERLIYLRKRWMVGPFKMRAAPLTEIRRLHLKEEIAQSLLVTIELASGKRCRLDFIRRAENRAEFVDALRVMSRATVAHD
jgi:hypothetical protein